MTAGADESEMHCRWENRTFQCTHRVGGGYDVIGVCARKLGFGIRIDRLEGRITLQSLWTLHRLPASAILPILGVYLRKRLVSGAGVRAAI